MKKVFQVLFALTLLLTSSLAAAYDEGDYFEAEGIIFDTTQGKDSMYRAAVMQAYRYLAEEIGDLYITSATTVQQARTADDEINARVEKCLRGAKRVSVKFEGDGSCHAIVRLPKNGPQSIAGAVLKPDIVIEDFPKPKIINIRSTVTYTGLIIDCRGMNLSEAISPVIKSAGGTEIYAYKNIGYQSAVNIGMVEYSADMNSSRAGNNPLTVKAVKISDKCDVVISDDDADKILNANQSTNFLINCAVVLVR
ncbi:MAG: hypothetical protein IJ685_00900 [Selenomonadaceae bacterium]|nr:hypothetical protein [Selenomonadaceae bacterium]